MLGGMSKIWRVTVTIDGVFSDSAIGAESQVAFALKPGNLEWASNILLRAEEGTREQIQARRIEELERQLAILTALGGKV